MSASNHNYVCFRCRTSVRHPGVSRQIPKCLSCGAECFWLGHKVEIPKHTDLKSWQKLEEECQRRGLAASRQTDIEQVRRQHFLEQEIRRLGEMLLNRDRNRQIRQLEKELLKKRKL